MQKNNPALNIGLNVVLFAVLIVLPFFIGNMFGNSWVNLLNFALIYVMLALGLNMVVGFAGLLDLGCAKGDVRHWKCGRQALWLI